MVSPAQLCWIYCSFPLSHWVNVLVTSHYSSQWWLRSIGIYWATRPQWVKMMYAYQKHKSPLVCRESSTFGTVPVLLLYPLHNKVVGGVYWFHSVRSRSSQKNYYQHSRNFETSYFCLSYLLHKQAYVQLDEVTPVAGGLTLHSCYCN